RAGVDAVADEPGGPVDGLHAGTGAGLRRPGFAGWPHAVGPGKRDAGRDARDAAADAARELRLQPAVPAAAERDAAGEQAVHRGLQRDEGPARLGQGLHQQRALTRPPCTSLRWRRPLRPRASAAPWALRVPGPGVETLRKP